MSDNRKEVMSSQAEGARARARSAAKREQRALSLAVHPTRVEREQEELVDAYLRYRPFVLYKALDELLTRQIESVRGAVGLPMAVVEGHESAPPRDQWNDDPRA